MAGNSERLVLVVIAVVLVSLSAATWTWGMPDNNSVTTVAVE